MRQMQVVSRIGIGLVVLQLAVTAGAARFCDQAPDLEFEYSGWLYPAYGEQRVVDDFHVVGDPSIVTFWGIAVDDLGQVQPEAFVIRFYEDAGGTVGPLVAEEILTARETGSYYWFSYLKLRRYVVKLSAPLPLTDGWIEIRPAEETGADFYWVTAPSGNDLAYVTAAGGYVNADFAWCFETVCAPPDVIVVDSTADTGADTRIGDGCAMDKNNESTLRAALMEANAWEDRLLIDMTALPMGSIIKLYAPLEVKHPVDVLGPGAEHLTISGQGKGGILTISNDCSFEGMTFSHGNSETEAAVVVDGESVEFNDCAFRYNLGLGAVRLAAGNSIFNQCAFEQNESSYSGAAAYTYATDASMILNQCSFIGNEAKDRGGALFSTGSELRVVNSFFHQNAAQQGAAAAGANMDFFNCTISGNRSFSGAVSTYGGEYLRMTNCSILRNVASYTTGIGSARVAGLGLYAGQQVRLYNNLIAGNYVPVASEDIGPDVFGAVTDAANNFIGDTRGSTGFVGRDNVTPAGLGISDLRKVYNPLPNLNGAMMMSHALASGSPAIDHGNGIYLDAALLAPWKDWDQRGAPYNRVVGAAVDLGAYEYQLPLVTTPDEPVAARACLEICQEICSPEAREYDFDFFPLSAIAGLPNLTIGGSIHEYVAVGILERVMEDPAQPLCCCARSAFEVNAAVLADAIAHSAPALVSGDLDFLLREYGDRLAAALTAGGPELVQGVQGLLEDSGVLIDLGDLDRRMAGVLGPFGDSDGDGACNSSETLAHYYHRPDYTLKPYVDDAMNPLQTEGIGVCAPCGANFPWAGGKTAAGLVEYFAFLDTDADAGLSMGEAAFWGVALDVFPVFDIDGNGGVDREELLLATGQIGVHAADQDADYSVNLNELLRVIQFFNTGGIECYSNGEDGYRPVSTPPDDVYHQKCLRYSADTDFNWRINLSELLRVVQIFNIGGYDYCPFSKTEDGFCPRAAVAPGSGT